MLIIKNVNEITSGKTVKHSVMGTEIELKIRPLTTDITDALRKKFKKEDGFSDALIDHVLEDFKGIGDETGKPLALTLENKKRVMNIPGVDGSLSVSAFVFNEAKKLALDIFEEETKNS